MKGIQTLTDALSKLTNHQIIEPNPPEKEGYEYGYAMYEPLPDVHVNSSKHTPIPPAGISYINTKNERNVQNKNAERTEIHLSLNSRSQLI